jgi:hypothetical protein
MLEHRPDLAIDTAFVDDLRIRLVGERQKTFFSFTNIFNTMSNKNRAPLWVGAGAMVILVVAFGAYGLRTGSSPSSSFASLFTPSEIVELKSDAFGKLALGESGANNQESASSAPRTQDAIVGLGGGGGGVDSKMIFVPVYYTYKYVGDPIELSENSYAVYKRNPVDLASQTLGNQLKHAGSGLLDLSSFGELRAENISLNTGEYTITLDTANGLASLYKRYDSSGYNPREARESDILPEGELINIANDFLSAHGINISIYAEPVVDIEWKRNMEENADSNPEAVKFIPHVMSVIYPFALGDVTASNYGGAPEGMRVDVDIISKKVSGVSNLLTGGFSSSQYSIETDSDTLLKFAEQGGINNYPWYDDSAKAEELELGTPQLVYVNHYVPEQGELYIPALQFPVVSKPQTGPNYYSKVVTIPLVQDIINNAIETPMPTEPPVSIMQSDIEPALDLKAEN